MKTLFTTGQVAKICKVSPRSVVKWFDAGQLGGFRLAVSEDRRIPREDLVHFLKERKMLTALRELESELKILLVGSDQTTYSILNDMFASYDYTIESAESGFVAGIRIGLSQPICMIIDFARGREEALMIARTLRKDDQYKGMILIGLIGDIDNSSGFDRSAFTEIFRKPYDADLLTQRIVTFVNRRQ